MIDGLSIVIPTRNRVDLVIDLLQSISVDAAAVDFPVEVLLVDDTPPPRSTCIRRVASRYSARILTGESNVAAKRNFGAREGQYPLILFLDSDVKIRPGTLRAHVSRLSSTSVEVAGCLGKVEFVGSATFAWNVINATQLTAPFAYPDSMERVSWGPTANFSVRRAQFLAVGGFDNTLPHGPGGEDVDLGFRLTNQRLLIVTAPDAIAEHTIETWSTWSHNLRRLWSYGLADPHLMIRHPDRAFFDLPTGPILWILQTVVLTYLVTMGKATFVSAVCVMAASISSYLLIYVLAKIDKISDMAVHLLIPVIFWTMDLAKTVEAIRYCYPKLVFKRLQFSDTTIADEWREIAASTWGLSASAVSFVTSVVVLRS